MTFIRLRVGTHHPRGVGREFDVVDILTVYLILLFVIPADLIFTPLGGAGTPANLLGMVCLLWWLGGRLVVGLGLARGSQPIRIALILFSLSIIASYITGMTRDLTSSEILAADRGLLSLAAWVGLALIAADGITTRWRLDVLLGRLVAVATLLAILGILEFSVGLNIASKIRIPGLHANIEILFIQNRSIFRRISGTSSGPIEFGVVLALALPISLARAFAAEGGIRWRRWLQAALIGIAIPMSLSRSGIIALVAVGLALIPSWDRRRRVQSYKVLPVVLVGMRLLVPGLLGTITYLFTNIRGDPSTKGRTDDYAAVGPLVGHAPFFGRGFHTYIPTLYRYLDNQYLMSVIETGFVGLGLLLVMFFIAISTARGARRRSLDPANRDLAQSFVASFSAAAVSFVTFDALSFPMLDGMLFLLIGCTGALWRFEVAEMRGSFKWS